ncbi:hypothetical protein [Terrisporobacter petrolearius]|uniref:hypothetical protein n=1 Tax=Terrisporobacter petrolearius TaxID=1460447 RepID=UPI003B00B7EC
MLKDKIKKFKFFICVNILLATIIGVYAQDIAYYIVDDYSVSSSELYLYLLTILTVLSIALFFTTPVLIYRFIKKTSVEKQIFTIYQIANILIGLQTSMSSLFVLGMSCG